MNIERSNETCTKESHDDNLRIRLKKERDEEQKRMMHLLTCLSALYNRTTGPNNVFPLRIDDGIAWVWNWAVYRNWGLFANEVVTAFLDAGFSQSLTENILGHSFLKPFGQCTKRNPSLAIALLDASDANPMLDLSINGMSYETALLSSDPDLVRRVALKKFDDLNRPIAFSTTTLGWAIGANGIPASRLVKLLISSPYAPGDTTGVAVLGPRSMIHVLNDNEDRLDYIWFPNMSHHPTQGPIRSYTPLQWATRRLALAKTDERREDLREMIEMLAAAESRTRVFSLNLRSLVINALVPSLLPVDVLLQLVFGYALDAI